SVSREHENASRTTKGRTLHRRPGQEGEVGQQPKGYRIASIIVKCFAPRSGCVLLLSPSLPRRCKEEYDPRRFLFWGVPQSHLQLPLMSVRLSRIWLSCWVLRLTGEIGAADEPAAKAPEVPVARAVVREVTDHEEFTGRTEAAIRVDLRARVSGYLVKT